MGFGTTNKVSDLFDKNWIGYNDKIQVRKWLWTHDGHKDLFIRYEFLVRRQ